MTSKAMLFPIGILAATEPETSTNSSTTREKNGGLSGFTEIIKTSTDGVMNL